jgi:hypothetical protein
MAMSLAGQSKPDEKPISAADMGAEEASLLKLRTEAEQGDAFSQWGLGSHYYLGTGVPQDFAMAMRWYKKAANQNFYLAYYSIGGLYADGEGVLQDYTEAVKWYQKAAYMGHPSAQHDLGKCFAEGKGVTQNFSEAYVWLNIAIANGYKGGPTMRDLMATVLSPKALEQALPDDNYMSPLTTTTTPHGE